MEYSFGTIRITAEIQDNSETKIERFRDVATKYAWLGDKQKEHIYAVFLDNDNSEIGDKLIGLGGRDIVHFDVQDIARTAALVNAGAVILVHNHPSGSPEPTQRDQAATEETYEVHARLGVELLDHVIISRSSNYSMKEHEDGPF